MQFPESWLRDSIPPIATAELAELLTMAGLEVEDTRRVAPPCKGVVVAGSSRQCSTPTPSDCAFARCWPAHIRPTARCRSSAARPMHGSASACRWHWSVPSCPRQREGGSPVAIKVGKLRGVDSFGMLCSARELKLSDDHGGLLELPAEAAVGADIRKLLALDDTVFTLKLTPNLAHALSVYGVAREVSALTGAPLLTPLIEAIPPRHEQKLPVQVDAPDLCGRFSGRVVRNVDTKAKTPDGWCSGWRAAASGRCRRWSTSRTT